MSGAGTGLGGWLCLDLPPHPCRLAAVCRPHARHSSPVSPGSGQGYKEGAEVGKPKVKVTSNQMGKEPHTSLQMGGLGP